MDEGDWGSRESPVGRRWMKGLPGINRIQGHPADKEHEYNDNQHADHTPLGHEFGLRRVAARTVHLGRGEGGHLQGVRSLYYLNVAAITRINAR